ncbi:MAG: phosphopantetheine-binding protein [Verrucomicrobiota bacterium]|nr:phosphopantetheine-binding protein [Verrucomicrobiota bacterium]
MTVAEHSTMQDELKLKLKKLIVETLNLEGVEPEKIADNEPLFGSGLNLDSIDALELVLRVEKEFGIKISSSEESRKALATINTLVAFIESKRNPGT